MNYIDAYHSNKLIVTPNFFNNLENMSHFESVDFFIKSTYVCPLDVIKIQFLYSHLFITTYLKWKY